MSDIMKEALTSWDKIKKLIVQDSNGTEDTLDWIYRSDVKNVEKILSKTKEVEEVEIKGQITIYDILENKEKE